MFRRMLSMGLASLALLGMLGCGDSSDTEGKNQGTPPGPLGSLLYTPITIKNLWAPGAKPRGPIQEIVVDGCRVLIIDKQDVPSLRDGVVKEIKVKEGQLVTKDQVLVQLDERLPYADVKIKEAKLEASKADAKASEKTRDESYERWQTTLRLRSGGTGRAISEEDVRAAQLTYVRYLHEAVSKNEGISLAKEELNQARVVLNMHQLHSAGPGQVKLIYRHNGESVKNLEPVLQVYNIERLRIEAMVDRQNAVPLHQGMAVTIEPNRLAGPMQTLLGHSLDVNAVAVSNSVAPLIVSASEDGMVFVWERDGPSRWKVRNQLKHPGAVRSVVCTPRGVKANLCLTGCADGHARLWDLNNRSAEPLRVLAEPAHRGAITAVAFAPDGKSCVTAGEDREIRLWDVADGKLRYSFPAGHRGAITSMQYTPDSHLVSAGRDNTLRYWSLHENRAVLQTTLPNRSGDVLNLGVSPDGKRVLVDEGRSLRVRRLPDGIDDGGLRSGSASNFTTFAQFAPDGRLVVTAGGGTESRIQFWETPTHGDRGHEVLQLAPQHLGPTTCCAFAPDGSFLVTGSKDRQVVVWAVPTAEECRNCSRLTGTISFVDRAVESASKQVRVWIDFTNPGADKGRPLLMPGDTATIAIDPNQK